MNRYMLGLRSGTPWITTFILTMAIAGPALALAPASDAAPGPVATGAVVGVVIGPNGSPLPGAVVTAVWSAAERTRSTTTGAGGEFRFADLDAGAYRLAGALHGFHPAEVDDVQVEPGRSTRIRMVLASATFNDTMEVRSTAPPTSVEASELRESPAADLGEALARAPGTWKVRKGAIANDIVLRGFRDDNIAVLLDGARVAGACPNRMDPPSFHLDLSEVDRVEIISGIGRMATQGGLGGLINVVTKKPAAGWHATIPVIVGSNDLLNPSATVSYGSERFGVLGGVSRRTSAPYEDGSGRRFTDLGAYRPEADDTDAFSVETAWTRIFYQPVDGHELSLSYTRQEADDVLYPVLRMDAVYDDTDRIVLGYRYEQAGSTIQRVRTTMFGTRVEHFMTDGLRTSSTSAPRGWAMGTLAETRTIGGSAEAEAGPFIIGVEAYERRWEAWTELAMTGYQRQDSIPAVRQLAAGASVRWRHQLAPATRLELGARLDRTRLRADAGKADTGLFLAYHGTERTSWVDVEPSASVELVQRLGSSLTLRGGAARTTRSPDPRELYFGLRRMGSDWVGNPDLEPPRSTDAELELTWDLGSTVLTATGWVSRVDGYIVVYDQARVNDVPGTRNSQARTYANVDATLRGGSMQVTAALGSRLHLAGQIDLVRGTNKESPDHGIRSGNLAEMPPLTARLALRWQGRSLLGELEGIAAARQDRVDLDLNERETAGYGIVNIKAGARLGHLRLLATLENLLDRTYREHLSFLRDPFSTGAQITEPGRRLTLTLEWSF